MSAVKMSYHPTVIYTAVPERLMRSMKGESSLDVQGFRPSGVVPSRNGHCLSISIVLSEVRPCIAWASNTPSGSLSTGVASQSSLGTDSSYRVENALLNTPPG